MKGILSFSGFWKQWGFCMKELQATLQTSHKTTKWTDLLTEPEESAGRTCEKDGWDTRWRPQFLQLNNLCFIADFVVKCFYSVGTTPYALVSQRHAHFSFQECFLSVWLSSAFLDGVSIPCESEERQKSVTNWPGMPNTPLQKEEEEVDDSNLLSVNTTSCH